MSKFWEILSVTAASLLLSKSPLYSALVSLHVEMKISMSVHGPLTANVTNSTSVIVRNLCLYFPQQAAVGEHDVDIVTVGPNVCVS